LSRSSAAAWPARSRANFSTGSASPVSADWLTNKSLAISTRQSAGIMSPADNATRSPGTSSRIGSSTRRAPAMAGSKSAAIRGDEAGRSTVAVLLTIARRRSADWLERAS
jgi:hypothetical protein